MAAVRPISAAIVGLGRAGWDIHVHMLRGRKDYQITGVVDVMPERLEEARREFGCRTFDDFDRFIKSCEAELVVVCTKSMDHCPMVCAALRAGKHVVVEKPMALNLREADRMIAAAKKARRALTVHQNHRHDPAMLYLRDVIKSGILGEVFFIRMAGYGFARRADWQMLRKFGGGQLNNWGSHVIDQALTLLKPPVRRVYADLRHTVGAGDAEDHIKIVLQADQGPTVDIELTNACAIPLPDWVVMGTCGTLVSQGGTSRIRYFSPKGLPKLKASEMLTHRRYGSDEKLPWQEKEEPTRSTRTVDFYGNLYDAIRRRKKLLITPQSVREVIRVQELCRRASGV